MPKLPTPELLKQWAELHAEGWPIKDIAEKTGFSSDTVSKYLHEKGVKKEKVAEGVGGVDRYERFKAKQELDDQKLVLKTVLSGYSDELQELYGAEKLEERMAFLDGLIDEAKTQGDLTDCEKVLGELGKELKLSKSKKRLKDETRESLNNLEKWQDYFHRAGVAWNADPQAGKLRWMLETIDPCKDVQGIADLEEFLNEADREIASIVERGRKRIERFQRQRIAEAERERRERSPQLIQQYLPIEVPREFLTNFIVETESQAELVAKTILFYWHGKRSLRGRERNEAIRWFADRAKSGGLNFIHTLDVVQKSSGGYWANSLKRQGILP